MFRRWTNEDIDYLEQSWGGIPKTTICKKLNRSLNSITKKASEINLGKYLEAGEYITVRQFLKEIGSKNNSSYFKNWVEGKGFPVRTKKVVKSKVRVIYIKDFWKWAENNKAIIDFSKFEEGIVGEEPKWVKEKRKADVLYSRFKNKSWSNEEDNLLKSLLNTKASYRDISQRMGRTELSINQRMIILKLKIRPIRSNVKSWTEEEEKKIFDLYKKGYKPDVIALELKNRSGISIRSKIIREIKAGRLASGG
jgi:hypothetical protein